MAGNTQLPQDLIDVEIIIKSDMLRKTLTDLLLEVETLKDRITVLESS